MLVVPHGLLYGRVLPFAAGEFVAATDAGEVIGGLLRGRVGLAPAAQAALVFAYEHLAVRESSAIRVVSVEAPSGGASRVRLRGPHGLLDVTVRIERVAADALTCANPEPGQYLRYRPVSATPVE